MKTIFKTKFLIISATVLLLSSCVKDLDKSPKFGLNAASVYKDFNNYKPLAAKIYGGLSLTGSNGANGAADVAGLDGGSSGYIRALWNMQELSSDEAVCGWNDPGIPDMNKNQWSANNQFVIAMYYRIYYQIALANEFIRQTEGSLLDERGFNATQKNEINTLQAEIRFLRAMNYYDLVDLYGKGPYIDPEKIGELPKERSRADHFAYIESELKAVENLMLAPKTNEYGRADRAGVWMLLSKLYLNAKVYINVDRSADAAIYAKKIIDAGYLLEPNYRKLFLTDNNQCTNEIIFPIISDGLRTQSYGLTTFLVHASIGGSKMKAADYGVNGGWAGLRAKQNLSNLFTDSLDRRDQLFKNGQLLEVKSLSLFSHGYAVPKFSNKSSTGVDGSDNSGNFIDTDFPLYRLGDVYLIYAEALLRSGGSQSEALIYFNKVRERAYNQSSIGNLTSLNLDQILDERGRELHWEAARRTDLIRFGKYTSGSYLWPFKGGPVEGIALDEIRNIFPIPQAELTANNNLTQNPGY